MASKQFPAVDKFLGINESIDGETELKAGEASTCENWYITDGLNLETRPGVRKYHSDGRTPGQIMAAWSGKIGMNEYLCVVDFRNEQDHIYLFEPNSVGGKELVYTQHGALGLTAKTQESKFNGDGFTRHFQLPKTAEVVKSASVDGAAAAGNYDPESHIYEFVESPPAGIENISITYAINAPNTSNVKMFTHAGFLFIMSAVNTVRWNGSSFVAADYYIPKVVTGAAPAGGGTTLENANMLTNRRRIDYSANGTDTDFVLPKEAQGIDWVKIDNVVQTGGTWDAENHTYKFASAPIKGVGNVEFQYYADQAATAATYATIAACMLTENYNGSTDTRLFVGGDGTNIIYYTGVPLEQEQHFLYFPLMYEIAMDMSASPVTAMVRHYSKLLVFKPDGAFTVSYDTISLPDGSTTAGFHVQAANREYGSDVFGQVQTVDNFPYTITKGGIYSWNITASYYKDERYARRVSEKVARSLRQAEIQNIVTCDDNYTHTYYAFLNDADGTVLVCRYSLVKGGIWFLYKSPCFRNVRFAMMHGGTMTIVQNSGELCYLDAAYPYDESLEGNGREAIHALWESGFNSFGIEYRRKSSALIYVSCIPRGASKLTITAESDRKSGNEGYAVKEVSNSLFSFSTLRFSTLAFNSVATPHINRVKLKVKKFVYYKLIFRADEPGCQASVLSYTQELRTSGMAK